MMKIGVMSDTHGDVRLTRRAIEVLDAFQVDLVLHCGDVGSEVLPLFGSRKVHLVAGNIDDPDRLRAAIAAPEQTFHGQMGTLEIEGCRIALLHGHDVKLLRHTVHSGHWDLVCHGHTHVFSRSREGSTVVLNPGAVSRTSFPSLAVVQLPSLEVTEIPL
ncbi:MAG: YfcE family phosphodiesterase [Thermoguttaceae bacterium]|jgi:putative phosphoesterase